MQSREEFAKELGDKVRALTTRFISVPKDRPKIHKELQEAINDETLLDAQAAVFVVMEMIFNILEG